MYTQTVSARELQTGYKKVLKRAQNSNTPIVVITNNKPVGAIISLKLLEKFENNRLKEVVEKARAEYKAGKTKRITSMEDFARDIEEMTKNAMK